MSLPRRRVRPEAWQPSGISELEPNALDVVRSTNNRSVIAGPGSGKTELLAQRASYLLQCRVCPAPQRILAISYKRDAAYNLAQRISARCHPEQAHRFDSFTFDAFAKSLIDRFGQALPEAWRPTPDYEIENVKDAGTRQFLRALEPPASVGSYGDIMAIDVKTFERDLVVARPLPETLLVARTAGEWAAAEFWRSWLRGQSRSFLSFAMIGRLAELLVRSNPTVRRALQLTYSHVFMDEFQDTTQVQYDLVKTTFLGSAAVLTAVGDSKQQIMRFAMAMDDPFTPYEKNFKAQRTPLIRNYRSSPDLVRIQHVLARALDTGAATPVSMSAGTVIGDSCQVWDFGNPRSEAEYLAEFIASEMEKYKLKPRDFCVLVRVRAAEYMKILEPVFASKGLQLRNEAASVGEVSLQDLLSEVISVSLVTLLRVISSERAGRHWSDCVESICYVRGISAEDTRANAKIVDSLDELSRNFVARYPEPVVDLAQAEAVVARAVDFVGRQALKSSSPAYRQGDWMEKVIAATATHLEASCHGAKDWSQALDVYEGLHAIPLMTIHKSKGLEYHTVVFVGLDDNAWFAFQKESRSETCGFFVAFTRAKQRVVFSYCVARGQRVAVDPLYRLLRNAGVKSITR